MPREELTIAPFPFLPVQITFIDLAIEGYPSLFLSFEKNTQRLKGSFLATSFMRALPHAIMVLIVCAAMFIVRGVTSIPQAEIFAIMYIALGFISLCAAIRACLPLNKLRVFLIITTSIGYFFAVWLFSYGLSNIFNADYNLLHLTLSRANLILAIILSVATLPLLILLTHFLREKKFDKRDINVRN